MNNTTDFKKEAHKILSLPSKGFVYFDDKIKTEKEQLQLSLTLDNKAKYYLKFDNRIINLLDKNEQEYFLQSEIINLTDDTNYFLNLTVLDNFKFYFGLNNTDNFYNEVRKILMLTDLEHTTNKKIIDLNLNEYYLFVLGCALLQKPNILIITDFFDKCPLEIIKKIYNILETFSQNNLVILENHISDYSFLNYQPISKHITSQNYIDEKETLKKEINAVSFAKVAQLFLKSQIKPILATFIIFFISFFMLALLLNKIDQSLLVKTSENPIRKTLYFYEQEKDNITNNHKEQLKRLGINYIPSYKSFTNTSVSIIKELDEILFDNVIIKRLDSILPNSPFVSKDYNDSVVFFSWDFLEYYRQNDNVEMLFNLNGVVQKNPRINYKIKGFYRYAYKTIFLNKNAYDTIFIEHTHKKLLNDLNYSFTGTHPQRFYVEIDNSLSSNEISTSNEFYGNLTVFLQGKSILSSSLSVVNKPRENANPHTLYLSKQVADTIKSQIEIDSNTHNFWHYECINNESELIKINNKLRELGFITEFSNHNYIYAINFFLPSFLLLQVLISILYFFTNKNRIKHLLQIFKKRNVAGKTKYALMLAPYLIGYGLFFITSVILNVISLVVPNYSFDLTQGCPYSLILIYLLSIAPMLITQLILLKTRKE